MDTGQSSIMVAVRVRPFTIREAAQLQKADDSTVFLGDGSLAGVPTPKLYQRGLRSVVKVVDDRCLVFDPPEGSPVQRFSRSVVPASKKVKDQVFAFDRVFDDNTTQADVYEGTTKRLLDSVLDGYNATVFAYGATGCGKTHTITGTSQQPGIIFLTMQELFEKMAERSQDKVTELSLSYLEIYNETIRDLLVPGGGSRQGQGQSQGQGQGLTLREDSNQAVTVTGLTSHHPRDVHEVMDMIVQGNEYRTVSATEANATSSRSHAVLQVNVAQRDRNAPVSEPHTVATLSIIDLAGSERASVTKNRGERLTEGANINKSLLALGSCINALCDRRQRAHVPYRNSKLTRLLKFSLGGNCRTVMIVCVSPSSAHFDETQNTLRYANRAKNIQTKVTRNVFNVNRHVKDFLVKIDEQMALINELRAQQCDAEHVLAAKLRRQAEKRDAIAREGLQRLRAAYDHAGPERRERVGCMKKLRAIERRIALLSAWMAAFDAVCNARSGDETAMPPTLAAVRKTACGILAELEHSRQHMHQRLERPSWERAMDMALAHGLGQLESVDGGPASADSSREAAAGLAREADLLKANFGRDAYREVLEQERAGDAATVQMLLTAQLDMVSSLAHTLAMDEESAVAHANATLHRLLQTGSVAASHVVKPDGPLPAVPPPTVEAFPPTRRGMPKRSKTAASYIKPVGAPAAAAVHSEHVFASPPRSPRRRKALGAARKGVSFTPVKKAAKSRGVRWRDDESEEGTLADFAKTPQRYDSPDKASPDKSAPDAGGPPHKEPSPSPEPAAKLGRFQADFLRKSSRALSGQQGASPQLKPPTLSLNLSSTPPGAERTSPPLPVPRPVAVNENTPLQLPPRHATSETGSDLDCSSIDPRKLRSAMHSAKKEKARRTSALAAAAATRPGTGAGPLASSTNGISRHRRASVERRRSPLLPCSPTELKTERSLTAGQARRMNMGGSVRLDKAAAPGDDGEAARRVTINVGATPVHGRRKGRGTCR